MSFAAQFKGQMGKAKMSGKGVYLPFGFQGRVKIKKFKPIDGYQGKKSIVWEYELLESNLADHPKGVTRSWTVVITGNDYAWGDLKAITFALMGIDPDSVPDTSPLHDEADELFEEALGQCDKGEVPLFVGDEVLLETQKYTTKGDEKKNKPSRDVALYKWTPTDEAKAARAEATAEAA